VFGAPRDGAVAAPSQQLNHAFGGLAANSRHMSAVFTVPGPLAWPSGQGLCDDLVRSSGCGLGGTRTKSFLCDKGKDVMDIDDMVSQWTLWYSIVLWRLKMLGIADGLTGQMPQTPMTVKPHDMFTWNAAQETPLRPIRRNRREGHTRVGMTRRTSSHDLRSATHNLHKTDFRERFQ